MTQTNENCESCSAPGKFCWNELITPNEAGAKKFYTGLFGWKAEAFPGGKMEYTVFKKDSGDMGVGGMMKSPSPGTPPHWLPYITVEDFEATVAQAKTLGGKVVLEPIDIPDVGRIAVITDPQGAGFGIIKPLKKKN